MRVRPAFSLKYCSVVSLPSVRKESPPAIPRNESNPNVPSGTTAGVSSTNESTRRPLIGRFWICSSPTTCDTSVRAGSTTRKPLSSWTLNVTPATCSTASTETIWPTRTSKSLAEKLVNPALAIETEYPSEGGKDDARNMPPPLVRTERLMPLAVLVTVTSASGTTAPEASRTNPVIAPKPATVCEKAGKDERKAKQSSTTRAVVVISNPMVCF